MIRQQTKNEEKSWQENFENQIEDLYQTKIIVPNKVKLYHPLVRQTKEYFTNNFRDYNGILGGKYQECLNIRVSKKLLPRALRIMHTIITQLERRNMKVLIRNQNDTYILVGSEDIKFRIREISKKVYGPSKYDKDKLEYNLETTGNLFLQIDEYYFEQDIRKNFKDKINVPLEDQINDFLINIMKLGAILIKQEEKRKEVAEIRSEKKKMLEEQLAVLEAEELKIENLFVEIENYKKSQFVKAYINELSKRVEHESITEDKKNEFNKWRDWANHIANCFDPLKEEKFTIVEEKKKIKDELRYLW